MKAAFVLSGEAEKIVKRFAVAAKEYPRRASAISRAYADEAARMVRAMVLQQAITMAPLSARYLQRKARAGLDTRILVARKAYVQTIEARVVGMGEWGVVAHEKLYNLLTYGTKTMPGRPHFQPVLAMLARKSPVKKEDIRALLGG